MNRPEAELTLPPEPPEPESHSLAHFVAVLQRYRRFILGSLAVLLFLYIGLALAALIAGPRQASTSVPFRIMFQGADQGTYPNGLPFNSADIVATPVLEHVHSTLNLGRWVPFGRMKSSVYVTEANAALERLTLEYRSKLSEPRLAAPDRERLEREFDLKKASIRRTDYALNFTVPSRLRSMPEEVRVQTLHAILRTWGEQAMAEKGAGLYRIPIVSKNILASETAFETMDYIAAIDVLRTKINRVIDTIDLMLQIPGAEVLRTDDRMTLPEIRVNLEDARRYRLEPLMTTIRAHRISRNPAAAGDFLQAQLESTRIRRDQLRASVDRLQNSLDLYQRRGATPALTTPTAGGAPIGTSAGGGTVIPQIDRTFLEQIVDMAAAQRDIEYRQAIIDSINELALEKLQPAESEVAFYEKLSSLPAAGGSTLTAAAIQAEYTRARNETERALDQIGRIYRMMSRNLNPGIAVYSLTDPAAHTQLLAYEPVRLVLFGLLMLMVAFPVLVLLAFVHNRFREESTAETAAHSALRA